jgi:hypothetical protein
MLLRSSLGHFCQWPYHAQEATITFFSPSEALSRGVWVSPKSGGPLRVPGMKQCLVVRC